MAWAMDYFKAYSHSHLNRPKGRSRSRNELLQLTGESKRDFLH